MSGLYMLLHAKKVVIFERCFSNWIQIKKSFYSFHKSVNILKRKINVSFYDFLKNPFIYSYY